MHSQIRNEKNILENKIAQLKTRDYLSEELIDLVAQVAIIQFESEKKCTVAPPKKNQLPEPDRIRQGQPLVTRAKFPFDEEQSVALFSDLIDILRIRQDMAEPAKTLRKAVDKGTLIPMHVFAKFLSDDQDYFSAWHDIFPELPMILEFLAQSSLTPGLRASAKALMKSLPDSDTPRPNGDCPICGSLPLISTLRDKEGYRYATCSLCHTEYRVQRIPCLFCGESDPEKVRYFKVKGDPGFRVEACDTCKLYIKTIDFRELDRTPLAILDDLDSLPFDYLAREQGYNRATFSAWGF